MLRILIVLLIIIHGIIHLIGFLNEWQLAKFNNFKGLTLFELPPALLKTIGLFWLAGCCLFIAAAIMFYLKTDHWWLVALIAVILSQLLVIIYWPDAKAGSVANLLVFLIAISGYNNYQFNNMVNQEVNGLFKNQSTRDKMIITGEMLTALPYPVQNWLSHCGIVGKENICCLRLTQLGSMKLKPGSEKWIPFSATQYFTTGEPAFIWKAKMKMMSFLPVNGRDKTIDGEGNMLIKALPAFVIADESGPRVNEASLQRWLAEICWFPSAALNRYIQWQGIDSTHANAILTYKGTIGTVLFSFDHQGRITECSADRYRENKPGATKEKWVIHNIRTGLKNGIEIPLESTVTWKLKEGDYTWFKLNITDIAYNIPGLYP
jgi:hypothetical protein